MGKRRLTLRFAGRFPALAAFAALVLSWTAPAQAATAHLPIYDLSSERPSLWIGVDQDVPEPKPGIEPRSLGAAAEAASSTELGALYRYLDAALGGDNERLAELYGPGTAMDEARQGAAFLRRTVLGVIPDARLTVDRVWRYQRWTVFLVRAASPAEVSSPATAKAHYVSIAFERHEDGAFLRTDNWGEQQSVHVLFWMLAVEMGKNGPPSQARPMLPVSIRLGDPAAGPTLQVLFMTRLESEVGDDLRRAAGTAEDGDDPAFLAWWGPENRRRLQESGSPEILAGARRQIAERRPDKDFVTVDLDRFALHVGATASGMMAGTLVERGDGRWLVSTELYGNVKRFVTGRPFLDALARRFAPSDDEGEGTK